MIDSISQLNQQGNYLIQINFFISGCPSVFDCYLVMRSIKTLELRVKAHCKNAFTIARYLEKNPLCEKVKK